MPFDAVVIAAIPGQSARDVWRYGGVEELITFREGAVQNSETKKTLLWLSNHAIKNSIDKKETVNSLSQPRKA